MGSILHGITTLQSQEIDKKTYSTYNIPLTMSISSLSAQLASLQKNGGSKHAGSSLASSKAHKDAIGRGIAHSGQHGHSISYGASGALHKPSVLYADSKSASDVPLTTLRENCVSSLRQLAKLTGNTEFVSLSYIQTLCGVHSLDMERGLLTSSENTKLDSLIQDLLVLLMTAMGESSSTNTISATSCFSSSLHVMEYLLRRHDVHKREATAECLVKCVLPFHEEPVFARVLQLVDLHTLPTFTVLRPFAQATAPPPLRTVLAKHASRDNALIQVYCDLAKSAASIHANECDDQEQDNGIIPRRGVSRCISFAAAVLVEALQLQVASTKYHGSISEATLRVILPFVLQACGGNHTLCRDWRGFGHVLASWMGEHVVLSSDARKTLASTLVKGALELQQTNDVVADCLATLMAVLSTSPNKKMVDECKSKLVVVSCTVKPQEQQVIGYDLPLETYKKLIQLQNGMLGDAIGCLYSDLNLDVTPLVASIMATAISLMSIDTIDSVQVMLDLIQGQEQLWKNTLTTCVAAAVLDTVAGLSESQCTETVVNGARDIMDALKIANPVGCDTGVAHAVTNLNNRDNKIDIRSRLVQVLGFSENELNVSTDIGDDMDVDESTAARMLPPRVALEHADASVRLHAIERLAKQGTCNLTGVGESLQEALLRHFLVEDDLSVVVAAGKALAVRLEATDDLSFDMKPAFANDCLMALEKWTLDTGARLPDKEREDSKSKKKPSKAAVSETRTRALEVALEIAGYVAARLSSADDEDDDVKKLLLQGIIAHFDVMESHAGRALSCALGKSKKKATKDAAKLMLTEEILLSGLRSCWEDGEIVSSSLFPRYIDVYSRALVNALDAPRKSKKDDSVRTVVSDALHTCVLMVQSEESMDAKASETLIQRFNSCAKQAKVLDASMLLGVITDLVSISSENSYKSGCIPAIHRLCDEFCTCNEVPKLRILMEAALRAEISSAAVLRLIQLADSTLSSSAPDSSQTDVTVFLLALLGHPEQTVRKAVLQLIGSAKGVVSDTDQVDILNALIAAMTDGPSNATSQIVLNGASALPSLLANIVAKSRNPKNLMDELLKRCYRTSCSIIASDKDDKRWLTFQEGEGGCRAAAIVLKALELSGESTSPLLRRYNLAGREILGALLEEEESSELGKCLVDLIHIVTRMMKGVTVVDSSSVGSEMIISTGPSRRGTRTRSYSVGRSPGVSFIDPYPKTMRDDLLSCLSCREDDSAVKRELCREVVHNVLGSPSWSEGVLKALDKRSRKNILESLLCLWKDETIDGSGEAFLGLELDGKDVADLVRFEGVKTPDVPSIIFLCDYIHTHTERLRTSTGYADLVSLLFRTLEVFSSDGEMDEVDEDEVDFARQNLLRVLGRLTHDQDTAAEEKRKMRFAKKDVLKWALVLVRLVGGSSKGKKSQQLRALPLGRPQVSAFSLLSSLCSDDPSSIVKMIVPAMVDSVAVASRREMRVSSDIVASVVPVFFKHTAAAGLNQFDLYYQVLDKASEIEDEKRRTAFLSCMVDSLATIPVQGGDTSLVGCFIAAVVAFDIQGSEPKESTEMSTGVDLAANVLSSCSPKTQVASLMQLVDCARYILTRIATPEEAGDENRRVSTKHYVDELETAVLFGSEPTEANQQVYRASLLVSLLSVVSNSLATTPVMNLVMSGSDEASRLSLSLWQDLIMLQSACTYGKRVEDDSNSVSGSGHFWDDAEQLIDSSLEELQSLLPAHLFLASAASLIEDGTDMELCAKAIGLISERASNTDSESPEASLFLDMLPLLAGHLVSATDSMTDEGDEARVLVLQSVFVAIEIFARSLCLKSSKDHLGRFDAFTDVLKNATNLIKLNFALFENPDQVIATVDAPSCQIVCSAALCAATLVRLLEARSIPFLPDLVRSLLSILSSVNNSFANKDHHWSTSSKGHATVLQVSILRVLLALTETLPQFLGPYLDQLLSPSALLSSSLRMDGTEQQVAVGALVYKLGITLSRKIPARQLIPSLCKTLPKCTKRGELQALLTMLQDSVQQAPRNEIPAVRNWLIKALTLTYEFQSTDDSTGETVTLVQEANEVLLALVMKLSEAQLRPLYAKLCEWKGDVGSNGDSAVKRYAFWSLSAMLSAQLRSIFLPRLSTVVTDAVQELELATTQVCGSSSKKSLDEGRKRQRLEVTQNSSSYLKPLFSCLESALHADAMDGGKWIRHDDSQRYHSLLSPLSKLLELDASSLESTDKDDTAYHELVHSNEKDRDGSVIGCLVALASAAGNEQLWKPLNHAVLQACGNEGRSQVRKAGVTCLLELIKALGEEYMVLLPECLPVLSEILEDSNEEIAGLAQECVSLGEELLGESLEDSLR